MLGPGRVVCGGSVTRIIIEFHACAAAECAELDVHDRDVYIFDFRSSSPDLENPPHPTGYILRVWVRLSSRIPLSVQNRGYIPYFVCCG